MLVVCNAGCARINFNPKGGVKLASLFCPVCGQALKRAKFKPAPDQLVEARLLVSRMETAQQRLDASLAGFRDLGPALVNLGEVLGQLRKFDRPHLVAGVQQRQGGAA